MAAKTQLKVLTILAQYSDGLSRPHLIDLYKNDPGHPLTALIRNGYVVSEPWTGRYRGRMHTVCYTITPRGRMLLAALSPSSPSLSPSLSLSSLPSPLSLSPSPSPPTPSPIPFPTHDELIYWLQARIATLDRLFPRGHTHATAFRQVLAFVDSGSAKE